MFAIGIKVCYNWFDKDSVRHEILTDMTEFDNFCKLRDLIRQEWVRHNVRSRNQFDNTFCYSKDWIRQQNVSIWIEFDIIEMEYCKGILTDILSFVHIFHTTQQFIQFYVVMPNSKYRLMYFTLQSIVELIHVNYKNCRIQSCLWKFEYFFFRHDSCRIKSWTLQDVEVIPV